MSSPWLDTFAAFMGRAQHAGEPMDTCLPPQRRGSGEKAQEKRVVTAQDLGIDSQGN